MPFPWVRAACCGALIGALAAGAADLAHAQSDAALSEEGAARQTPQTPMNRIDEELVIIGSPTGEAFRIADPVSTGVAAPDASSLLRRIPGGNFNAVGPISGQAQYRGLSSIRLNLQVDGQRLSSGGPNLMDPPLHYVPKPILDSIEIVRGVAPVSLGPGIGGTIQAKVKSSEFESGPAYRAGADLIASGRTADDSVSAGGIVSYANDRNRVHVLGTYEDGDDYSFPGGTVRGTQYGRSVVGIGAGRRLGDGQEIAFDYRYHDTEPTGTPALPLDIFLFNTHIAQANYEGGFGAVAVDAKLTYTNVDHAMSNFTVRPAPGNPMAFRFLPVASETVGYKLSAKIDFAGGEFEIGSDGMFDRHDADITNPNNPAFFIEAFDGVERNRVSGYGEWHGMLTEALDLNVGVRLNHVATDAEPVFAALILPPPLLALAAEFNARDRSRSDLTADIALNLRYELSSALSLHLGGGRKTRVPYYTERYAWLPVEITAGLADFNNHVGDIGLEPETAWVVDGGIDWYGDGFYLSPRAFYRRIDDYIQSTPFDDTIGVLDSMVEMVSAVNGDPTPLVWANVDAELFGVDVALGSEVVGPLRFDAVISYVRGKRRDVNDDLYRIAPATATLALSYEAARWRLTVEGQVVAEQDKVSQVNGETPTDGYGLLDVYGELRPLNWLLLVGGVENVFDTEFREHLAGFNRVAQSDVAVGQRLPGRGVSGFVRARIRF